MSRWLAAFTVFAFLASGCGSNLGKIDHGTVPIKNPPTNVTPQKGSPPPGGNGATATTAPNKGPVKPGGLKK